MKGSSFGSILNGYEDQDIRKLVEQLHGLCKDKNLTLAVAESMTGGLISSEITALPGGSGFFLGGVVCYQAKTKYLLVGVNPKTISEFGAVSKEVTMEMAVGIKKRLQAEIGLAVTGVAGPGPGVFPNFGLAGSVYTALVVGDKSVVKQFHFEGSRDEVRLAAVRASLRLLVIMVREGN